MTLSLPLILAYVFNIGVLFFVLWRVLYKPVKKYLDEREARYLRRTEDVERKEHDTAEEKAKYDALLSGVHDESEGILRDTRSTANRKAEEILAEAEKQAEDMLRKARKEIADEQRQARLEMRDQIVDLAVDMASRILEREVTAEDHRRIVDRFLKNQKVG